MWPDAYYFSTREFANGAVFVGVGAYALNRAQALVGDPNPTIYRFLVPPGGTPYNIGDGLLPSDLDGTTPPPGATTPNYFVGSMDNHGPYGAPQDALTLWKFHYRLQSLRVTRPFMLTNTLPTAPFDSTLGYMRWSGMYPAAEYRQSNRSFGLSTAAAVSACLPQFRDARVAGNQSVGVCRHGAKRRSVRRPLVGTAQPR